MNAPQIQELLNAVQVSVPALRITSKGLDSLSLLIEQKTESVISVSTLKRIWGYVNDEHEVRVNSLDILARFVGYRNFEEFKACLKKRPDGNSYFFSSEHLASSGLNPRELVKIGWARTGL